MDNASQPTKKWSSYVGHTVKSWIHKIHQKLLRGVNRFDATMDPPNPPAVEHQIGVAKPTRLYGHIIAWLTVSFLVIIILWANYAIIDKVSAGEGKVVPASQVQLVQNLEGGIIKQIFVHSGDIVKQNQVLIQLDDTRFLANFHDVESKVWALKVKIAGLSALINNQPFTVSADIQQAVPDLVAREMALYVTQKNMQQQLIENNGLNKKEYTITKPLVSSGAVSDMEVVQLQGQMALSQQQLNNFNSKVLQDLDTARTDLITNEAALLDAKDRLQRTTIRSPVNGVVKNIKITTIGGVAEPGATLMEIVPLADTLIVETQINPKDIGFIKVGQQAEVKITAYDYSIYGGLSAKVESISADTITNPRGDSFYVVRVRTDKNYLGSPEHPLRIIPGMMAMVDIQTGKQSILHAVLAPLLHVEENALHER